MLRNSHFYMIASSVNAANAFIDDNRMTKPSRVLLEFTPNDPLYKNNLFTVRTFFVKPQEQITIYVREQTDRFIKHPPPAFKAVYICPNCGAESNARGQI
tara:strand:- start:2169 stop:2468 length:300 start_codon:yes stop_codon:yes gene_type:complete